MILPSQFNKVKPLHFLERTRVDHETDAAQQKLPDDSTYDAVVI
jgi:hypothetical protein